MFQNDSKNILDEDGNKKNSIKYTNSETIEAIKVTSFSENNLYISNSVNDVTYEIELEGESYEDAKEFVEKIEKIEQHKKLISQSIKETEELFNARMDYYFD